MLTHQIGQNGNKAKEREMKLPLNTIILTFFILLFLTLIFVVLKKFFKSGRK